MVPPHPPPPPRGVVWWWVASLPPVVWCGVVVGCFLWCGVVRVWALVVPPLPPLWRGVGWVVPPCMFGSAWGVWQTHAHDDSDDDNDDNHDQVP